MKRNVLIVILAAWLVFNLCGCVSLVVGGAVGAGGYAISHDAVQGDTDRSYDGLWAAAEEIARDNGTIKQQDSGKGYIELNAGTSTVWIRIIRLTQHANRLKVSARNRYHLPDITLAQRIYTRIIERAK